MDLALMAMRKLKKEGKLCDMTMSEFADFYRDNHPNYNRGECALWKDILYGSDKQYFWYADPAMRTCLDFNQKTGIGTDNVYDASYPYLIQINYRAGFFTHYAGAGTVKSCKVSYHGKTADLCLCRTMAKYERGDGGVRIAANPVTVTLDGLDIVIESVFTFEEGSGKIITERRIVLEEYFTGAFGTTEYQADMTKLTLGVDEESMRYSYLGRKITHEKAKSAYVVIPDVMTKIEMGGDADKYKVEEGIAFSPVYHISLEKKLTKGAAVTWLSLQKEN